MGFSIEVIYIIPAEDLIPLNSYVLCVYVCV